MVSPDLTMKPTVYWADPCSVCGGSGGAFFVKSILTGKVFFCCVMCGIAWEKPPFVVTNDKSTVNPPEKFAPDGIALATKEDIVAAGMDAMIIREDFLEEWSSIKEFLD